MAAGITVPWGLQGDAALGTTQHVSDFSHHVPFRSVFLPSSCCQRSATGLLRLARQSSHALLPCVLSRAPVQMPPFRTAARAVFSATHLLIAAGAGMRRALKVLSFQRRLLTGYIGTMRLHLSRILC